MAAELPDRFLERLGVLREVLGFDLGEVEPAGEIGVVVSVAAVLSHERPLLPRLRLRILAPELAAAGERERGEHGYRRRYSELCRDVRAHYGSDHFKGLLVPLGVGGEVGP